MKVAISKLLQRILYFFLLISVTIHPSSLAFPFSTATTRVHAGVAPHSPTIACLFAEVPSSTLLTTEELPYDNNDNSEKNTKLSRPERKALERARNQLPKKKKHVTTTPLQLPDNAWLETTTPEELLQAMKRAQNRRSVKDLYAMEQFLLDHTLDDDAGSLWARLAVAALHLQEHTLARRAMTERRLHHRMLPMESAAMIRGLLRNGNVTEAWDVLEEELSLSDTMDMDRIVHRALSLGNLVLRHFLEQQPTLAVQACATMATVGPMIREVGMTAEELKMPWTRIVQAAAQCEAGRRDGSVSSVDVDLPCNLVYAVLNTMTTFPAINDDQTYEALSNALVRRVLFVTGAVNMEGCPVADRGEAAFIGRSNVGKSSLVNMVRFLLSRD